MKKSELRQIIREEIKRLTEYEDYYVDKDGNAHDDEGNVWFVGKQYAGQYLKPNSSAARGSRNSSYSTPQKSVSKGGKINPKPEDMKDLDTFKKYLNSIGWFPKADKLSQMYQNTKKWKKI